MTSAEACALSQLEKDLSQLIFPEQESLSVTEEEVGSPRVLSFSLGRHLTQIRQCWKRSSFTQFAIRIFSRKLGEKLKLIL